MMKVALYARVSKSDDSQTNENQLLRLRDYAKQEGYDVYAEYADLASGADPNRPALERMLKDARGRRFSLILAVRLDRIARSMVNFHDMLKTLSDCKVKFHCTDQPEVSTDSSTGTLVMGILGYVAQFERDLIRDRTKAGLERARAQGKHLGRPKLAVKPGEISDYRASGVSVPNIAKSLGVSKSTVQRRLKMEGVNLPSKNHEIPVYSNTDDYDTEDGND
jgi:putative DNA-invertase from lambdoid prophage Rac